jgi:hypothetical protein
VVAAGLLTFVSGTGGSERCFEQAVATGVRVSFCVEQVTQQADGSLKLDVSWIGRYVDTARHVAKGSDAHNRNMYLTDDLGNRYDHMDSGGAAASEVTLTNRQPAYGWFLFPPPAPGATHFTFHDDDNGQSIGGIALTR